MMEIDRKETSTVLARAWYVKYPLDAYALGPYRYQSFCGADQASDDAYEQFGERPTEIWPEGKTHQCEEYEYLVQHEVEGEE